MTDFDDPWDEFSSAGSTFQSWTTPGDQLVGTIVSRGRGTDANGQPCPQLVVRRDDDTVVTVNAGQKNLQAQMISHRDELQPGARVRIKFTGVGQAKPGQSPPKLFDIDVKAAAKPAGKAKKEPVTVPAAEPETSVDDF